MTMTEITYLFFAIMSIASALGILITRNVIHAAFLLVVCLVSLAGLYVIYQSEYVAVVQLLVYAGGIVVLLSFGIMLTGRRFGQIMTSNHLIFPGIVILGILMVSCAFLLLRIEKIKVSDGNAIDPITYTGVRFMTEYIIAFELIAYLLLVVLVGASYLAKKAKV